MPLNIPNGIRWTDGTWNVTHGCFKVSEGCRSCWAARQSQKFGHTDKPWTVDNIDENLRIRPDALTEPDTLDGPRWLFVPSSSDLFLPQIPEWFIEAVQAQLEYYDQHCFQVLTKHGPVHGIERPAWPENVILAVSIATPKRLGRLDWLREQDATTKAVSFEPLVKCIPGTDLDLSGIDWIIIGGETGPADERRPMDPAWARNLVRAARRQDVAVFFKQHSGARPEQNIELDMGNGPERIEEFPDLPDGVVPAPVEFLAREVPA